MKFTFGVPHYGFPERVNGSWHSPPLCNDLYFHSLLLNVTTVTALRYNYTYYKAIAIG
ncbi:hypothetical protein [Longitalea arenae]|uniref:hypothetical protein n=1 Tax=Longitalea arenae TaxID=2812558 RepID=UPI0019685854|nr:hypothetical protein [Longitalea arenae]